MIRDWDDAYANTAHVPDAATWPARWADQAAACRARLGAALEADIPYGPEARARFDLIWPEAAPRGVAVFVHGGYWMKFDKSFWTHLAEGARQQGWAVALPNYPLAPAARLAEMTAAIGCAVSAASARVEGPVHLAGHSAGGHLVTRMLCADSPLDSKLRARLRHVLSISGLHDLRPLMRTRMNVTLGLDLAAARTESAALAEPFGVPDLTVWVGGAERPEFIRQARLMALAWDGFDGRVRLEIEPDQDHFSVIRALSEPRSPITRAFVG